MNIKNNHFLLYFFLQNFIFFKLILNKAIFLPFNELYNNNVGEISFLLNNNDFLSIDEDISHYNDLYENLIYTAINIGSQNQLTMSIFNSNTNIFSINNNQNCYKKPQYNYSMSETSKIIKKIEGDDYFPGHLIINDNIKLYILEKGIKKYEEISEFEIRFDLPKKSWGNEDKNEKIFCAEIGLQINQEQKIWAKFIKQLKDKELINSYTITLNYSDTYGGFFYIGEYPHEYEPNNYKELELITTYIKPKKSFSQFRIIMDDIYFQINENKKIQIKSKEVYFHLESGIIECATEYFSAIKNIFFDKYLNDSTCKLKYFTKNINYYNVIVCDDNNFDIKNFPNLYFYHSDLKYYFNLSYIDLFQKKNNKYYFLIIYSSFSGGYWKLGKPFFKKYQITLNLDAKSINFYNNNKINNNNDINRDYKKEKIKNIILIIFCLILVSIIIIIVYLFINKIKGQRKRRANELKDDGYEYSPNKNNEEIEKNEYKNFLDEENNNDTEKNNFYKNDNNAIN